MFKSIQDEVLASIQTKEKILNSQIIINQIQTVSDKLIESYKSNGKLLIAGNGGSAADAQHIAGDTHNELASTEDIEALLAQFGN